MNELLLVLGLVLVLLSGSAMFGIFVGMVVHWISVDVLTEVQEFYSCKNDTLRIELSANTIARRVGLIYGFICLFISCSVVAFHALIGG